MVRNGLPNSRIPDFDETFDVVVVGFGFAGAFSAIHAADAGCRVLLAEKQAVPGRISICSYGSIRFARKVRHPFSDFNADYAEPVPSAPVSMPCAGLQQRELGNPDTRHD